VLKGKKIIVGISASIAAYKAILLVRLLKKEGAEIRVVMTQSARDFVSPLVLSTLSEHPVWIDFHTNNEWNNHVELGLWADAMIIAPATCNTLAKMANGICDNLLIATYLSARCPVFVAPAMDEDMFKHPSNQQNMSKIVSFGNHLIQTGTGFLASGLIGEGRLAEPEEIVSVLIDQIGRSTELKGMKVLINAGPTREAIDPVRYISNHSTGKMGISLAEQAYLMGAEVCLVLGPSSLKPAYSSINVVSVESADAMLEAMQSRYDSSDVVICSAAVADYKLQQVATEKIKKKDTNLTLDLVKNVDILAFLGETKKNQFLVGFALETEHEEQHAKEKLKRKKLDAIVLNSLRVQGAGFGTDTNQVKIFFKDGESKEIVLNLKTEIAKHILSNIVSKL